MTDRWTYSARADDAEGWPPITKSRMFSLSEVRAWLDLLPPEAKKAFVTRTDKPDFLIEYNRDKDDNSWFRIRKERRE